MKKWRMIFISGLALVFLGGCAHTDTQKDEDLKVRVETTGRKAEAAFLAGDVDAMLQYYTEDVISMPEFYPMVKGKEDLRRKTEAILSAGIRFKSLESTTLDVKIGGRYVYEIGTFRQAVILPGTNEPTESSGKYVTIWEKQKNGDLKIAVEIYNSDTGN
jgi:ketosteroid isomerase-like protein